MVKVIASSIRKGNILEVDDKLYVVLTADNIHPGKGTPVTHLALRRISDGVKTEQRYRTTENVERAFVEDVKHTYLFETGGSYTFMNTVNYDQVEVPASVVEDYVPYLQENMDVSLSMFNGTPISMAIPARVTFEIVETEPALRGQTASGSFKPAILSNGLRVMVPQHIESGTRIVISTEDGSYVERSKA